MDCQVVDFTLNGKCSNCGQCCSNLLPLSDREIRTIKSYIKKRGITEQRHNVLMGRDMTCPFRDDANKKCLIYAVRPQICRSFMCNHKKEDIINSKIHFHQINKVVFMRNEFFGSSEDTDLFKELFTAAIMSGAK